MRRNLIALSRDKRWPAVDNDNSGVRSSHPGGFVGAYTDYRRFMESAKGHQQVLANVSRVATVQSSDNNMWPVFTSLSLLTPIANAANLVYSMRPHSPMSSPSPEPRDPPMPDGARVGRSLSKKSRSGSASD